MVESTGSQGEEFFGLERLESILRRMGPCAPRDVLREVEGRLTEFHGARGFDDDATMVVARFGWPIRPV